jgi:ureidoglycolate hydrolase
MGLPCSEITQRATAMTAASIAPFGEVMEVEGRGSRLINAGTYRRFDDITQIDVTQGVNYRRNTWHHALVAPGENCGEVAVDDMVLARLGHGLE